MVKRRKVIESAAALVAAGLGQGPGQPVAEGRQHPGFACPDIAGRTPLDPRTGAGQDACGLLVGQLVPKPDGLPVVVAVKINRNGRDGKVVFAEAGEMLPEDVEGLKKYL